MDKKIDIGERLKFVRRLRNYSQAKVAKELGIKLRTYQAYEQKRAETPVRVLMALSTIYGYYSIDCLLGMIGEKDHLSRLMQSYGKASQENRKIVDFVLSLNN